MGKTQGKKKEVETFLELVFIRIIKTKMKLIYFGRSKHIWNKYSWEWYKVFQFSDYGNRWYLCFKGETDEEHIDKLISKNIK